MTCCFCRFEAIRQPCGAASPDIVLSYCSVAGKTGFMPYPKPLNVVVGAPVEFDPSSVLKREQNNEQVGLDQFVDVYHEQYVTALKQLWNDHKAKYGRGRRKSLDVVE